MHKRTLAVLFVCWGLLSAGGWWLWSGTIGEWVTQSVAGRADPSLATFIASASASALPFVGAAVVMLVVLWLTQPTRRVARPPAPRPQPARSGESARGRDSAGGLRKVYIKPAKMLVHSGARFGIILVNGEKSAGPGVARDEIYFKKLDDKGTLVAQIPRGGHGRPQLRYFVDYRGLKFERVKRALAQSRFTLLTRQQDRSFRAWFAPSNSSTSRTGPVRPV